MAPIPKTGCLPQVMIFFGEDQVLAQARIHNGVLPALVTAALLPGQAAGEAATGLKSAEIEAAFVGKTLQIRTEKTTTGDPANPSGTMRRTDGGFVVIALVIRPDNSIIYRCTFFDRAGRPGACARPGVPARDVGVWLIEGDRFCYQWLTARGGRKQCYEVAREGTRFRLHQASGPPSLVDGEVVETK